MVTANPSCTEPNCWQPYDGRINFSSAQDTFEARVNWDAYDTLLWQDNPGDGCYGTDWFTANDWVSMRFYVVRDDSGTPTGDYFVEGLGSNYLLTAGGDVLKIRRDFKISSAGRWSRYSVTHPSYLPSSISTSWEKTYIHFAANYEFYRCLLETDNGQLTTNQSGVVSRFFEGACQEFPWLFERNVGNGYSSSFSELYNASFINDILQYPDRLIHNYCHYTVTGETVHR